MTHTWQMSRQRRGEADWWWTCSTTWTPSCQWRLCGARGSCWWLSWPHSTGPPCRILLSLGRCYSLNILVKNLHICNNTLCWENKIYNMFTWRMSNSNILHDFVSADTWWGWDWDHNTTPTGGLHCSHTGSGSAGKHHSRFSLEDRGQIEDTWGRIRKCSKV